MDKADVILIQKLTENADVTAAELVPYVNLSIPSINKRIDKMKKIGVISNFTIITNPKLIGKPIVAFILMTIDNPERIDSIKEYILNNTDILECYSVTGAHDLIIKVRLTNIDELETLLSVFKRKFGVVKTQTMMGLSEHKFVPCPSPKADIATE